MTTTRPFRIVLIEDEAATARNLEYIIREIKPAVEIMATLQGVTEAVDWLAGNHNSYDLIFSDIRLSDGLSFEIFRQTNISKPVIFVTAYNDYAIEAFRNNGIDYILKPFDEEEIRRALLKYNTLIVPDVEMEQSRIAGLLQQLQSTTKSYKKSFLFHYCGRLIPVESSKIHWFYTANEIVYAHTTEGKQYIVASTLEQLEQQLDPALFFRANRQFIIHRNAVDTVEYFFNGRLVLKIHPSPREQVLVSKARAMLFRKWLDQ
ncbi:response regulator transcription factor [Chitinophaga polysaccharea]|uniref:LytR/AlgR family response regulator transcription factor n=1 Tax=Chitinophaga TaxID=79328 RepID=UPI0014552769|nr:MULTISPECIES: LytTR family DNA-binding domain-containing protein [Chitinophaga]NLR61788.1 response regulator transcription factor [Chitinophaga polysaccharea]NLU92657.1 response regulator transcription factor [Chitinophaga sp. Ak27]